MPRERKVEGLIWLLPAGYPRNLLITIFARRDHFFQKILKKLKENYEQLNPRAEFGLR